MRSAILIARGRGSSQQTALAIHTGVRDHEHERAAATLEAGAHHLNNGVVLVLMHFVDEALVRARAALLVVGGDGAEGKPSE